MITFDFSDLEMSNSSCVGQPYVIQCIWEFLQHYVSHLGYIAIYLVARFGNLPTLKILWHFEIFVDTEPIGQEISNASSVWSDSGHFRNILMLRFSKSYSCCLISKLYQNMVIREKYRLLFILFGDLTNLKKYGTLKVSYLSCTVISYKPNCVSFGSQSSRVSRPLGLRSYVEWNRWKFERVSIQCIYRALVTVVKYLLSSWGYLVHFKVFLCLEKHCFEWNWLPG